MGKNLVIVESPAKAKTIEKYLGKDFVVMSSYGHVRDLAKGDGSIDIENGFEPKYIVSPDKKKIITELKKMVKSVDEVWLASDEDREGEAISWHLKETLGLDKKGYKRITFNEITKSAVLKAIENPRDIDNDLVNAQQARRILDRLVGFELSPVLWRKVKPSLSAGRVQSVAVRLVVEREQDIEKFESKSFFRTDGLFRVGGAPLKAKLNGQFDSSDEAKDFVNSCLNHDFTVKSITKKPAKKSPTAPFTTSTLQQEASLKLGFSVSRTMSVAQRLYESGLITYMRTDSVNLSETAVEAAKNEIESAYGTEYFSMRKFKTKSNNAQEAHEAIRPTHPDKLPKDIKEFLDPQQHKLYKLIWERTIAGQMPEAELDLTTIVVEASKGYDLTAKGRIIKNPGFMKVYIEGTDHPEEALSNKETLLPAIEEGEKCDLKKVIAEQKFTQPPARYTEATLVKKMEAEGIGRPSTYAPTISTIINRGYMEKKEDKKLHPQDIGLVVNDFLVENFGDVIDYQFTAHMEEKLDAVADGKMQWQPVVKDFYGPFEKKLEHSKKHSERATGERILGKDPKSGRPLSVRIGRYGPMAQIGTKDDEEKPKFAKLLPDQSLKDITMEEALDLFKLPRDLGEFEDDPVMAAIGRFGPYVRHQNKFYSLPKELDPYTVHLDEAVTVIKNKREEEAKKEIQHFYKGDIYVLNGRFGPYIKKDKRNYKIPKDKDPVTLTLEECEEIIKNAPPPKRGRFTKKK